MADRQKKERILCIVRKDSHDAALVDTLLAASGYDVVSVFDFEEAVEIIANDDFSLLVTQFELPDMSAIDVLVAVNSLRPRMATIVIDDNLNPQHALRAFRLGAIDYLYRPVNLDFLLIRIEQELVRRRERRSERRQEPLEEAVKHVTQLDDHILKRKRAAAFVLGHAQFNQINGILSRLQDGIAASFVGLLDSDHNVISAVGDLGGSDLITLRQAFSRDYGVRKLADVLQEESFSHTYLSGENNSVFISDFGEVHRVSLVIVTASDSKPGMVVHSARRAAGEVDEIIRKAVSSTSTSTREHPVIE